MKISEKSLSLFKGFAEDSFHWSGTPMVDISKEERGNLTQLKRAGLVTTWLEPADEYGTEQDLIWLEFTEEGYKFAAENGIEVYKE